MSKLDDIIDEINEKIDVIPNIDRESIKGTLKILPFLDERERTQIIEDIGENVDVKYHRLKMSSKNPVLGFPNQENSAGEFPIGYVCAGDQVLYQFFLTMENLRENVFVTARAGHGKTTFIFYCVDFLIKNQINFIFVDWKNDYRTLAQKYPGILVIRWSDIRFNPLTNAPQGVDIKTWWRVVLDILSHSQGLLMATPSYILQIIEELYEDRKGDVTFRDVGEYLKTQHEDSKKKDEYASVAENRIYNINQALDKVLNVRHGFNVTDLFNKKVIIEMSPLDFPIASFLIQTLIMHEFYRRLINNVRMNRKCTLQEFKDMFSLIVLDEAHLTQYSGQERSLVSEELSPSPLTKFFSQSRELLMGTISATQFPQLIMDAFKNNAGTKIVGNLTESDVQRKMASSLGLDRDEEKFLGRLDKGFWIATVSGRAKPFLLNTPEVTRGNLIAEEELLQRTQPMLDDLRIKQQEIESRMFLQKVGRNSNNVHVPDLTKEAWMVLDYALNHPFQYQDKIRSELKLSTRKLLQARRILIEKGLIRIEKFTVLTRARTHFALTDKALSVLKSMGKSSQKIGFWRYIDAVSFWHRFFQFYLRSLHETLDCKGTVEFKADDGRRIDLFETTYDGWRKAIELEKSTKDLENKLRVLADGLADELVLLYKDEKSALIAREKMLKIEGIPGERVWVGLASDYATILVNMINGPERSRYERKRDEFMRKEKDQRKLRGNNEGTK